MPISRVRQYMAELIHIVGYLHSRGVAHRDLTSRNVVIDERGRLVVIDFGMGRSTGEVDAESGLPYAADEGTLAFLAPERLSKAAHVTSSAASSSSSVPAAPASSRLTTIDDCASDCWSLGILLYEMLFGSLPFQGEDEAAVRQAILDYRDDDDETAADGGSFLSARQFPPRSSLNKDALDLLSKLMRRDPTQRLSIMADGGQAIQRHPLFNSQQATIEWQLSEHQNFGASMWSTPSPVEFARHLGALDPEVDAAAAQSAVHIDLDEK
jgi:serine/threonine protein kinase